jgi:hypothetical protein
MLTLTASAPRRTGSTALVAVLSAGLVLLGVPAPVLAQAEPTPVANPVHPTPGPPPSRFVSEYTAGLADGAADGAAQEGGALWFGAGCLLGVLGVVVAAVYQPAPSVGPLLGRSAEYSMGFTEGFRSEARRGQLKSAMVGCGVTYTVIAVLYLVLLNSVSRSGGF